MHPEIKDKLKSYISDINRFCRIEKVVLFGSYAKGTPKKDSDIDQCHALSRTGEGRVFCTPSFFY